MSKRRTSSKMVKKEKIPKLSNYSRLVLLKIILKKHKRRSVKQEIKWLKFRVYMVREQVFVVALCR